MGEETPIMTCRAIGRYLCNACRGDLKLILGDIAHTVGGGQQIFAFGQSFGCLETVAAGAVEDGEPLAAELHPVGRNTACHPHVEASGTSVLLAGLPDLNGGEHIPGGSESEHIISSGLDILEHDAVAGYFFCLII